MIELAFDRGIAASRRAVFESSADRWNRVIETDFAPIELNGEVVTGLRIDVSIRALDGENGVLGQAGPTVLRPGSELPVAGLMEFDQADVLALEESGRFEDVVLH